MRKVKIQTDGSSLENPGHAGIGAHIDSDSGERLAQISEYIGITTNNVAEYTAIVTALKKARELGATHVELLTDSMLIVNHFSGKWCCNDDKLIPLWAEMVNLSRTFESCTASHIRRDKNGYADMLAGEASRKGKAECARA